MNRYVTLGILTDLGAGKDLAVVGASQRETREAFLDIIEAARRLDVDVDVRRANGREWVGHAGTGGQAVFRTPEGVRGLTADVVVSLGVAGELVDPIVLGRARGEVIHA